jgi:hypothetical protein
MALKAILKSNDRLAFIYKTQNFHEAGDNFFPKNRTLLILSLIYQYRLNDDSSFLEGDKI